MDSGSLSQSGKCWKWVLDEPYPWRDESEAGPQTKTPRWQQPYTEIPQGLRAGGGWKQVARWHYFLRGGYRFTVVRFEDASGDKTYRSGTVERGPIVHSTGPDGRYVPLGGQPLLDGIPRRYQWGLAPEERIPYRADELVSGIAAGHRVWIVEGEKSADALMALGEIATTNPGGSAQWPTMPEHWLAGVRDVRVVVDRDAAGEGWARDVLTTLRGLDPVPQIQLLQSATTGEGDDAADHLEGHGLDDFVLLL